MYKVGWDQANSYAAGRWQSQEPDPVSYTEGHSSTKFQYRDQRWNGWDGGCSCAEKPSLHTVLSVRTSANPQTRNLVSYFIAIFQESDIIFIFQDSGIEPRFPIRCNKSFGPPSKDTECITHFAVSWESVECIFQEVKAKHHLRKPLQELQQWPHHEKPEMGPCDVPLHIRLVLTHKEELNTQPAKAFYPRPLSYW